MTPVNGGVGGGGGWGSVNEVVRDKSGEAEYQMATLHVGTLGKKKKTHPASLGAALIIDRPQFCRSPHPPPPLLMSEGQGFTSRQQCRYMRPLSIGCVDNCTVPAGVSNK